MAFNAAISGLNAAKTDLEVTGNNIANAATVGFKVSRAEFADIYAASNLGVSADSAGQGVRVSAVTQQFSQGNIDFTNNNLDLAINGQGFFMLDDSGSRAYTRAGSFGVNREGYVVNSDDQRLMAFAITSTGASVGSPAALQLDTSDVPPLASSNITVGVNLPASADVPVVAFDPADPTSYTDSTSITLYDSLGGQHQGTVYFRKTADNTWDTHLYVGGAAVTPSSSATLQFSNGGALVAPANGLVTYDPFVVAGAAPLTFTVDYAGGTPTTQFGDTFGVNALSQDGYTTGRLGTLDIDPSGQIFARYTNGQTRVLGVVALANFANPQGLRQVGNNNWVESFESGTPLVGPPGTAQLGTIQSGALEDSNVDLTEELVNLIISQRNFQANAQVISTADQITQTLINLR